MKHLFRNRLFWSTAFTVLVGLELSGILINYAAGPKPSLMVWILLSFVTIAIMINSYLQAKTQEKSEEHMRTMLQEVTLQTYLQAALIRSKEQNIQIDISMIVQQRTRKVLTTLDNEQRLSLLNFFLDNGLLSTMGEGLLQDVTFFRGENLHKIALPGMHLEKTDLSLTNLSEAQLNGAYLQEASLYKANLTSACLSQAKMKLADMRKTTIMETDFSQADLDHSLWTEPNNASRIVSQANFQRALLRHLNWREISFYDCDFTAADLSETDLSFASLPKAKLQQAHLQKTGLLGTKLQGANLTHANLQEAYLTEAYLTEANLTEADLRGAILDASKITKIEHDYRSSDVIVKWRPTVLNRTILRCALLQNASFRRADLRDADLRDADLRGTNLQRADLKGANLTGAVLDGADLRSAKITREQLITVRSRNNIRTGQLENKYE